MLSEELACQIFNRFGCRPVPNVDVDSGRELGVDTSAGRAGMLSGPVENVVVMLPLPVAIGICWGLAGCRSRAPILSFVGRGARFNLSTRKCSRRKRRQCCVLASLRLGSPPDLLNVSTAFRCVPCNQHPPFRSLRRLRPHLQPSQRLLSTILVGWSPAWPAPLGWLWRSVGLASPSAARPSGAPVSCLLNFITYGNPWLDRGTFMPSPAGTARR